jgi:hypothetical protein
MMMKTGRFLLWALCCVLPFAFTACLFKEPVFSEGFAKTEADLAGVWLSTEPPEAGKEAEQAVLLRIDDAKYLLHYPARDADGIYFLAQPLKVGGKDLLQLQALGSPKEPVIKPGAADVYTLVWMEKQAEGRLAIRPLNGKWAKTAPAEVRKMIEAPDADWSQLFAEPQVFKRAAP